MSEAGITAPFQNQTAFGVRTWYPLQSALSQLHELAHIKQYVLSLCWTDIQALVTGFEGESHTDNPPKSNNL